jgi:S1-C subfamily serine protease
MKPPETSLQGTADIQETDDAVTRLVEKSAPAVVSIIIKKAVPQAQATPFGNLPFFFPFSVPNQDAPGQAPEKQKIGSGSGFFVSADGMLVTNKHVVADEDAEYTVVTSEGKEYEAKVLARDPVNDIAVLKVDGANFPFLSFGNSDQLKVGQTVVAIGNPLGEFANSVSRGIISGLQRSVSAGSPYGAEEQLAGIIQTDAAINPGNSGGPLLDIQGAVIGVNVAVAQGAENIGFALPINQVKSKVDQVKKTGKIQTPYIGVRYVLVDDELQKQSDLPYNYGALILRGQNLTDFAVVPGSPADKAGLVENDIILEVEGTKIDEKHPLATVLNGFSVGQSVNLKVWHKGEEKTVTLTLGERQSTP